MPLLEGCKILIVYGIIVAGMKPVMFWKKYRLLLILFVVAIAIRLFALFPAAVEQYYSDGIYPVMSRTLRFLFGWIPFSIGDILYALAVIYLVRGVVLLIRTMVRRKAGWEYWRRVAKRTVYIILWVYILFNGLWGLNYNRIGIAKQMGLNVTSYTTEELTEVVNACIDKLVETDVTTYVTREIMHQEGKLFSEAWKSYERVRQAFAFLEYRQSSVKASMYGYLGNYMGYTGYYNPFTGEAQVNTTVPMSQQPFTTCHEIGHQLGFAKENEANFVGYLAGRASENAAVKYSVYFDLYIYASRNLALRDTVLVRALSSRLPEMAKKDLRDLRAFYKKYENPFEPVIRLLYGQYLKANEQPQGILSYDEVIAWVIAYYRKYGEI